MFTNLDCITPRFNCHEGYLATSGLTTVKDQMRLNLFDVRDQMNSALFMSAIRDQMRLPVYDVRDQVEQARLVSAIRDQTGLPHADVKDQMTGRCLCLQSEIGRGCFI